MIDVDEVIEYLRQNKKSIKNINLKKWDLIESLKGVIQMSEEEKYRELYEKALSDLVQADKRNIEKDKIIEAMAEELVEAHEWFYSEFDNFTKEDFIKYFENKVNSSEQ